MLCYTASPIVHDLWVDAINYSDKSYFSKAHHLVNSAFNPITRDKVSARGDWFNYDRGVKYYHSDERCIHHLINSQYQETTSVITKYGTVTGAICYLCDMPGVRRPPLHAARNSVLANVTLFLGVPYAKPPTKENNLRFKDPQAPENWGSIDALEYKASCPQPVNSPYASTIVKMSEDCLYINIFSPHVSCSTLAIE